MLKALLKSAETWSQKIREIVGWIRIKPREVVALFLALGLFYIARNWPAWLPETVRDWMNSWHGVAIFTGVWYAGGTVLAGYAVYRIWKQVRPPRLPPPEDRPAAIKGPMAFTEEDGPLFRRLGREPDLKKLLDLIQDDQVPLVVVMGASGAGKTSLLRAGLAHVLGEKKIGYHYWEAVPTKPEEALLHAIRQSWEADEKSPQPQTLKELLDPSSPAGARERVIVLDQFEQLGARSVSHCGVFRLLRKLARETRPPHRVTWIVAFRREFRADWSDFLIPEQERGFHPPELSLRLFSRQQAEEVVCALVEAAGLSIEQRVIDSMLNAAVVEGEVSPVDIGIGMLEIAELAQRKAGDTLTLRDYRFAGGSEGLLTEYMGRKLESFPDEDREKVLKALLALTDPKSTQRLAEGLTAAELAKAAAGGAGRLTVQLDYLVRRDVRLLEKRESEDGTEPRYRLPHDRLVPALRRLTGRMLAAVDQARLKLESAFQAWLGSGRRAQYLLRGADLRRVARYQDQIPWGKDQQEKQDFLRRSRRRCYRQYTVLSVMAVCLLVAGWLGARQFKRHQVHQYLRQLGYPVELYDWQHQLQSLTFSEPLNLHQISWVESTQLEELSLTASPGSHSIQGIGELAKVRSLRKLTLDLSSTAVRDLGPLAQLPQLQHLTFDLSGSAVSDLGPLAQLPHLQQLSLDLSLSAVTDLGPLAQLPQLQQLSLDLGSGAFRDLGPLAQLPQLQQLSLTLGGSAVQDLGPLAKLAQLPQLQQLFLDLGDSAVSDLGPLAQLPQLRQLSLNLDLSAVSDLRPLAQLPQLRQLSLNLSKNRTVYDLGPLAKLPQLQQLSLDLGDSRTVHGLGPLAAQLPQLQQLSLDLRDSGVQDLGPLAKLPQLQQLCLNLSKNRTVYDLGPLAQLPQLRQLSLDLGGSAVRDLGPLAQLPQLRQLSLDLGGSAFRDLGPLAQLPQLQQLSLNLLFSAVSDLEPLANLPQLQRLSLDLGASAVRDLGPLAQLPQLQQLSLTLGNSAASDLGPLAQLTSLTHLKLRADGRQIESLRAIPRSLTHLEF